jgi:hypothetical protein
MALPPFTEYMNAKTVPDAPSNKHAGRDKEKRGETEKSG